MYFRRCFVFILPNGGYRNAREAAKFKALGVRSGVPDIIILKPNKTYHALMIELKVGKNNLTENQKQFLVQASEEGYAVAVCRSLEEFMSTVEKYIKNEWSNSN